MFWKHEALFHIYQIHYSLLGRCKAIPMGEIPSRVTQGTKYFLDGKVLLFIEEEHSYFKLYCFE